MENAIIAQLEGMAGLGLGKETTAFYKQMVKDCRPVQCERMRDVLTDKQREFINAFYRAQKKKCYRNAAELVFLMERSDLFPEPVRYIEGYTLYLIVIEHGFVKYGEHYFDPTLERAVRLDVRKEQYVSLLELAPNDLRRYLYETGHYGNLYEYAYLLEHNPARAAVIRKMNE